MLSGMDLGWSTRKWWNAWNNKNLIQKANTRKKGRVSVWLWLDHIF